MSYRRHLLSSIHRRNIIIAEVPICTCFLLFLLLVAHASLLLATEAFEPAEKDSGAKHKDSDPESHQVFSHSTALNAAVNSINGFFASQVHNNSLHVTDPL